MTEFSVIDRFCRGIGSNHPETSLAVGDDAAVIQIPDGKELAISVDTMVEAVHFFPQADPGKLARKLLAVNLSDMAAMGAEPKWATLALTMPAVDEPWLASFSKSLHAVATAYGVQLIGGDTTQGPLTLSLQIMGLIDKGQALTRDGCELGDDLYVSGCIGDSALTLASIKGDVALPQSDLEQLEMAFYCPIPQCALGQALVGVASSCIDVSDGLVGDLTHIARASNVSMVIRLENLPLSESYSRFLQAGGTLEYAICGGEDYQLAFTASRDKRELIAQLAKELEVQVTRIGVAKECEEQPIITTMNNKAHPVASMGYQHFN